MSLKELKNIVEKKKTNAETPEWVNVKNSTSIIFKNIVKLKVKKEKFIVDLKSSKGVKKSQYQISASEISRNIGLSVPTIISTSSYSKNVRAYLKSINSELESLLVKRKRTIDKYKSNGIENCSKKHVLKKLRNTQDELRSIKNMNVEKQVLLITQKLSLNVKKKLGINLLK